MVRGHEKEVAVRNPPTVQLACTPQAYTSSPHLKPAPQAYARTRLQHVAGRQLQWYVHIPPKTNHEWCATRLIAAFARSLPRRLRTDARCVQHVDAKPAAMGIRSLPGGGELPDVVYHSVLRLHFLELAQNDWLLSTNESVRYF